MSSRFDDDTKTIALVAIVVVLCFYESNGRVVVRHHLRETNGMENIEMFVERFEYSTSRVEGFNINKKHRKRRMLRCPTRFRGWGYQKATSIFGGHIHSWLGSIEKTNSTHDHLVTKI